MKSTLEYISWLETQIADLQAQVTRLEKEKDKQLTELIGTQLRVKALHVIERDSKSRMRRLEAYLQQHAICTCTILREFLADGELCTRCTALQSPTTDPDDMQKHTEPADEQCPCGHWLPMHTSDGCPSLNCTCTEVSSPERDDVQGHVGSWE